MKSASYTIPTYKMVDLLTALKKINKRAAKNGLAPLELKSSVARNIERTTNNGWGKKTRIVEVVDITLTGEYPAINGWHCIAKIDHDSGVNLINIYDEIDVDFYRNRKPTCDHCGHNKIKVLSYLIQNIESGEIKQIGKSCLAGYIKADPATMFSHLESFSKMVDELSSDSDDLWAGGKGYYRYDIFEVALIAALSIRKNGFVPSGANETNKMSTWIDIADFFNPPKHLNEKDFAEYYDFTDEDNDSALGMIEHFEESTSSNNFTGTIKGLIEIGNILPKYFAYVAGAMSGYFKHLDRTRRNNEKNVVNEHVGTIKKRQDFTVTLENVHTMDGYYGEVFIHRFLDDAGHTLVWFANNTKLDRKVGDTFKIKGTVKKFDEYNGRKQTIINRVKDLL